jgi:hypothetical protein
VTRPEGMTRQLRPARVIERVGIAYENSTSW